MTKKKILILYTSVGLGHKTIAENIGWYLEQAGYEVKLFDVLKLQAGLLVSVTTAIHQVINKYTPFIWKWLYIHADHGWFAKLTLPNRVKAASRNYQHVKQIIDEYQPDLTIGTQVTASGIIQFLKQQGLYKGLFGIAFSDYHLHRYWLYEDADLYLINIEEQKQDMIQLGIPAQKIFVLGMTLKPKMIIDTVMVKQRLGIAIDEKVVLAASGSLGTGLSASWFVKLAANITRLPKTKLIIVCGKNKTLYKSLRELLERGVHHRQVIIEGYYSPLAELYAIADIFLTKPGGLSVAEALQWQLPLLITHWLPGGEELNYKYLTDRSIIMPKVSSVEPSKLLPIIEQELAHHAFRRSLNSNPSAVVLTQRGNEGQTLVQAINEVFHDV